MENKIPYSDFAKLELKVGEIISIENHPNADKLYILKVNIGEDKERQIVAGLKPYYPKEQLLNKKAIFVTNLEVATIRGVESNGMILAADDNQGKIIFLTTEKDIEIGSKIR